MLFFLLLITRHENHFGNPLDASKAQLKVKLIIFLFPLSFSSFLLLLTVFLLLLLCMFFCYVLPLW